MWSSKGSSITSASTVNVNSSSSSSSFPLIDAEDAAATCTSLGHPSIRSRERWERAFRPSTDVSSPNSNSCREVNLIQTFMAPNFKRQKTCGMAYRDWAELSMDFLGLILEKLTLPDQVRFSCVCKSWKLAVKERAWSLNPNSPPYLMLPDKHNKSAVKFYSLSDNKSYHIPIPNPRIGDRELIGSCYGWLITVHKSSWDMHLLNPVTGVQIRLPSITTAPYFLAHKYERWRSYLFYKAILSSPPSADGSGDFSIILIPSDAFHTMDEDFCAIATMRVGDNSWTTVTNIPENIVDIVSYKEEIFGVDARGLLYIWDQHRIASGPKCIKITGYKDSMGNKMLVGSVTGDQIFMLDFLSEKKNKIDVIRIDRDKLEPVPVVLESVVVNDLSDNIFFADSITTFAVPATRFPELRRNCIYFTKDNYLTFHKSMGNFDAGVFDLKDESIKPIPNVTFPALSFSTWIIPKLL